MQFGKKGFFGQIEPRTHVPVNNVVLVGVATLAGAFLVSYQLGAELLNFGALIAFMGVNVSALVRYYVRNPQKRLGQLLPPLFGFAICFGIWLSLRTPAKIGGLAWLAFGLIYGAWKTQGFRRPIEFNVSKED